MMIEKPLIEDIQQKQFMLIKHSMNLIPGNKWCRNCEASINQIIE